MKRFVMSALGVLLVAGSVGLTGCESGGVDPGMPKDTTPGVPLKDMTADMTKGPKAPNTPPGAAAPAGGAAPTTPEPAKK